MSDQNLTGFPSSPTAGTVHSGCVVRVGGGVEWSSSVRKLTGPVVSNSEGVRRIVLEVLDMTMAGCSHTMSCGSLNTSLLAELDIHQLVEDNCEMTSVCGERIILVLADMVMCLTGACEDEEDQFPDWARPATCAAIAVTVLVFFSIMYFGKSCSESRVKVRNSVPL